MNNNSNNNFFELIVKGVSITTPITILSNDLYELTNDKKRLISKVDEVKRLIKMNKLEEE